MRVTIRLSLKELLPENIPSNLKVLDVSNNQLKSISYATALRMQYYTQLGLVRWNGNLWTSRDFNELSQIQEETILAIYNRWN